MWCILIILSSSLSVMANNDFNDHKNIRSLESTTPNRNTSNSSSDICSIPSINIDTLFNESNTDVDIKHNTSTTIDIIGFRSSWQRKIKINADHNDEQDNHTSSLNIIEIIFSIPYTITSQSIYNKTLFIMDDINNQLLASLTNICINGSSFIINYSTVKSLPHNVCLYLLLNKTLSTALSEVIFCRTIDDSYKNTSASQNDTATSHSVGPSGFFIISQCIIILIMMFVIYAVQTARQKSLLNRFSERLIHSRPYVIIFGQKTPVRSASNHVNNQINPSRTLQSGLNDLVLHRHLTAVPNHQIHAPIDEQILAVTDLTSTLYDRKASKTLANRDLINVKEFTKRMSAQHESSTDTELYAV